MLPGTAAKGTRGPIIVFAPVDDVSCVSRPHFVPTLEEVCALRACSPALAGSSPPMHRLRIATMLLGSFRAFPSSLLPRIHTIQYG